MIDHIAKAVTMAAPTPTFTAVSAPGKVLLAGGYLVLDPECKGLVFSLSARIHAIATPSNERGDQNCITVTSPQFKDARWEYTTRLLDNDRGVEVIQVNQESSSTNKFIQTTIQYVLSYLSLPHFPSFNLTVLADNDYYSQPSQDVPRFNSLDVQISAANKTGLGSSAALVTSLTGCLLKHLGQTDPKLSAQQQQHHQDSQNDHGNRDNKDDRNATATLPPLQTIHNLSQASHCAAQGKVGSGFDVAAAVYGSCVYSRFSPSILESIGDATTPQFTSRLTQIVNSTWEMTVTQIHVPHGLGLMMCDVDCGSATPGMVRSVMSWRSSDPNAQKMWQELDKCNQDFMSSLQKLGESEELMNSLRFLHTIRNGEIPAIRGMIKKIGELSNVPIEPVSQTALIDAVSQVSGVLGGVVPGAGGFDAVCFLYIDMEDTEEKIKTFLREYNGQGGKVTPLHAREENEGLKVQTKDGYAGIQYMKGLL